MMPYFLNAAQRKQQGGTCYFEFQMGRFRRKHWLERSVYLHADQFDQLGLADIFSEALPHFAYCGVTEVTPRQYNTLRSLALARGGEAAAVINELDGWTADCFLTEHVFTICGI